MSYQFLDVGVEASRALQYFLEDIDVYGRVTRHGPILVETTGREAPRRGRQAIRVK